MAKRAHRETGLDLDGFEVEKILMNDPKSKRVHVLGKFKDCEDNAIITMVKTPFSNNAISKLLSADTTLQEEFRNDIYGKYDGLTKPSNNVISTSIIKPATPKHIEKYTQKLPYVLYETAHDYEKITKPYIETRAFSIEWVYNILGKYLINIADEGFRVKFRNFSFGHIYYNYNSSLPKPFRTPKEVL